MSLKWNRIVMALGLWSGQPKEYLLEQIAEFRSGNRRSSVPSLTASMILAVTEWGDDDLQAAVGYFSALPRRWLRMSSGSIRSLS